MTTSNRKPGDINRNDQILITRTDQSGTDHNQYIWVLVCARRGEGNAICGHRYGANGSDFHLRKCPVCQGGAPGLVFDGVVL